MASLQIALSPFAFVLPMFLFLLFLYKWLVSQISNSTTTKNFPPSPPKLPIIGNLHQLGADAHRSVYALSRKYGDLIFLQLGTKPSIFICSAKSASLVLKTFDAFFAGRPDYVLVGKCFYDGKGLVFQPYGENWRHMRSVCVLQLLTNKRVRSFGQVRVEEMGALVKNIRESSEVNLSEMFMLFTSDVICKVAFGRKYNREKDGVNFAMLLKNLAELFGSSNIEDVLPWMAWINWVNGFNAKVKNISRMFDELLEKIILEHESRVTKVDNTTMTDFVDILLEAQRDANAKETIIDKESIKGVLMDMFAAGTHTGQVVMEWAFTEILRHPRVMEKLQQEVRGITRNKKAVMEEDLEKMVYLKAVIKETFRLHPPLPFLVPRQCTKDVKIDGYDISSGTQVYINVWAIGRDPACWEEPESFSPDRFLNSRMDFRGQDFELIPFGAGRRICPGISFAMVSVEYVLANLVHQFDWGLPVGRERETLDIAATSGLSSNKLNPLIVVPTPRVRDN